MPDKLDKLINSKEHSDRPLDPSEVEVNQAKVKLLEAETRKAQAEADVASIVAAAKQREEKKELAKDQHNHVYVLDDEINARSVKECIQTLTTWSRQDLGCDIELQINSPGGSIVDGFALIDFIRSLQDKGHNIDTIAFGWAASMGGVILQVGNRRIMGKNATLLIHEGSLGAIGDFGQVEDRVKLMKLFHERILDIFEDRAKSINPKTTKAFIKRNWLRTDWWISSEEALKFGFVDEIR